MGSPSKFAESNRKLAELFDRIALARKAVERACGGPWKRGERSASGKTDCPVCWGRDTLHYHRAGRNGHIHGQCRTPGCVSWVE